MKIEVFFSPAGIDELGMRGRNVIIIDVLRATTTICTALSNGAREVIPTADIENATKISSNLSSDSRLLGGERQGKKIDGFDLGNSPAEYTPEKVKNRSIIFTTTNGAGAIHKCRYASTALVASFVNVSAIVETIVEIGGTWTILCSGRQGAFSVEDATCAGMIISKVKEITDVDTEDAGLTTLILYKNYKKSILGMLKKCAIYAPKSPSQLFMVAAFARTVSSPMRSLNVSKNPISDLASSAGENERMLNPTRIDITSREKLITSERIDFFCFFFPFLSFVSLSSAIYRYGVCPAVDWGEPDCLILTTRPETTGTTGTLSTLEQTLRSSSKPMDIRYCPCCDFFNMPRMLFL